MGNCIRKQNEKTNDDFKTSQKYEEKYQEKEEESNKIIDTVNDIIKKELNLIRNMSMCNINNIQINKTTNINILYIEDNKVYFFLINQILKKHYKDDINLIWKDNITDGYNYIKNNNVDLILLDRTLEDGTGDDLIYKLKDEDYDIKKIILISVIDELTDVDKFNKMGLNYYIKPLKVQEFINIMNIILNHI